MLMLVGLTCWIVWYMAVVLDFKGNYITLKDYKQISLNYILFWITIGLQVITLVCATLFMLLL